MTTFAKFRVAAWVLFAATLVVMAFTVGLSGAGALALGVVFGVSLAVVEFAAKVLQES